MAPAVLCPTVRRRRFLRATATLSAVAVAGCVGGQPDSPGDGSDGTPTPPTDGTPTQPPTSFTMTSARCGNQVNRADVTVEDGTVTVEGATWGNEACYVARLRSATLDDGTLTLQVVTERAAGPDEACAQCIAEIEYRATVETPSPPDEVVVVHDGETVATVSIT